jgi:hypothetical protein
MVAITQSQIDQRNAIRKEIDHWESSIALWQRDKNNPNINYPPQDYIDGFKQRVEDLKKEEARLLALEETQRNTPGGPEDIEPYLFSDEDKQRIADLQTKYNELSKVGPDGETIGSHDELQDLQDEIEEAKEDARENVRNRK